MAERFGPAFGALIDEWHAAELDPKVIAAVEAALGRYNGIAAQRRDFEANGPTALRSIADQVAAGDITFDEGLATWSARAAAGQQVASGRSGTEVFYDEARRAARRATEAAAAKIDWRRIHDEASASESLRSAIRVAGLMR